MLHGAKIPISDSSKLAATNTKQNNNKNIQDLVPKHFWPDMDQEVETPLALGVIQRTEHEEDEVISPGGFQYKTPLVLQVLLNLKHFSEAV